MAQRFARHTLFESFPAFQDAQSTGKIISLSLAISHKKAWSAVERMFLALLLEIAASPSIGSSSGRLSPTTGIGPPIRWSALLEQIGPAE
jgi:hypothetical protein